MILVKSVEIERVSNDTIRLSPTFIEHQPPPPGSSPKPESRKDEIVYGREFVNERGERVMIGMTKEVQTALGLPFMAYENIRSILDDCHRRTDRLRKDQKTLKDKIYSATFFQRLKYLFTGNI